jgi:hypothetical protein
MTARHETSKPKLALRALQIVLAQFAANVAHAACPVGANDNSPRFPTVGEGKPIGKSRRDGRIAPPNQKKYFF